MLDARTMVARRWMGWERGRQWRSSAILAAVQSRAIEGCRGTLMLHSVKHIGFPRFCFLFVFLLDRSLHLVIFSPL